MTGEEVFQYVKKNQQIPESKFLYIEIKNAASCVGYFNSFENGNKVTNLWSFTRFDGGIKEVVILNGAEIESIQYTDKKYYDILFNVTNGVQK